MEEQSSTIRVQKYLAHAGFGSRRACDALVSDGRVAVNGSIAEPGTRVHPDEDEVTVDGVPVHAGSERIVIALNKPWGVVTTMSDDRGRPCVGDLFADYPVRLFHVGRLDEETEGLLLLSNDGDLANLLMHPSHGVSKTYVARVRGRVTPQAVRRLLDGVRLEDGPASADAVVVLDAGERESVIELRIHEGRKRIVRRMCKAVGHPVVHLTRTAIGGLLLDGLASGAWRRLQESEIAVLRSEAVRS